MPFKIVGYPYEYTDEQIKAMYAQGVADEECIEGLESVEDMAHELDNVGLITLAEGGAG